MSSPEAGRPIVVRTKRRVAKTVRKVVLARPVNRLERYLCESPKSGTTAGRTDEAEQAGLPSEESKCKGPIPKRNQDGGEEAQAVSGVGLDGRVSVSTVETPDTVLCNGKSSSPKKHQQELKVVSVPCSKRSPKKAEKPKSKGVQKKSAKPSQRIHPSESPKKEGALNQQPTKASDNLPNDDLESHSSAVAEGVEKAKPPYEKEPLKTTAAKVDPKGRGCAAKSRARDTKITAFFPVRKSDRKTESQIKQEQYNELKNAILSCKEDGLEVKEFEGKGRGVVAKREYARGEFVVEYRGELISRVEALKREEMYRYDSRIGCYMYYFMYQNKHYCVDATQETDYKARLINHSAKEPNCVTKVVEVDGRPCIALFSSRRVRAGEELLYNYGDRSRASIAAHPWLINS